MKPTPSHANETAAFCVPAPLHQCEPLLILTELFEQWGNECSPPTKEDGGLPPGFLSLQVGDLRRFFHEDDLRNMLRELHATLVKQQQTGNPPHSAE